MRQPDTNEITIAPSLTDIDLINRMSGLGATVTSSTSAGDISTLLGNTSVPPISGLIPGGDVNAFTTLRQVFPKEVISDTEIQAAIEYRNAFKQGDIILAYNNFIVNLKDRFTHPDFSIENILYWFNKYKYSHKEFISYLSNKSFNQHTVLVNQLPGAAKFTQDVYNNSTYSTEDYFSNISDSIGTIVNTKYIQLDSTQPIFDMGQTVYGVPITFSASLENKISATTRNVTYALSKNTTALMRRNLLGVSITNTITKSNYSADASTPHGLNLINDLPTFIYLNSSLHSLKEALLKNYKQAKLTGIINYLNNIGNSTGINLRDIFPVQASDQDFNVMSPAAGSAAAQAVIDQEVADAAAEQALFAQAASIDINSTTALSQAGAAGLGEYDVNAPSSAQIAAANSAAQQRNADFLAAHPDLAISVNQSGVMDETSFKSSVVTFIQGDGTNPSPLLSIPANEANAKYGITNPSDPNQWADFFWRTANYENDYKVYQNAQGVYDGYLADGGGSYGWGSVSPTHARAAGLQGSNQDLFNQLQNPVTNMIVTVSETEREITKAGGQMDGLWARNGGQFAGLTMTKLSNGVGPSRINKQS